MFKRMFRPDPLKSMDRSLASACPDPALWDQLSAYLTAGRRPAAPRARAALRAYLDLRDHLAGRAAFRCGAELSHEALAGDCHRFMTRYQPAPAMQRAEAEQWARFLLAADHLLALAHDARLAGNDGSQRRCQTLEGQLEAVHQCYLAPLRREFAAGAGRPDQAPAPLAGPEIAAARAA